MFMQNLDSYRGKKCGDIIKVNSCAYPNKKLAKVIGIYKVKDNIRFLVKIGGGIRLDIHTSNINFEDDPPPCYCAMDTLFREGCICGGV